MILRLRLKFLAPCGDTVSSYTSDPRQSLLVEVHTVDCNPSYIIPSRHWGTAVRGAVLPHCIKNAYDELFGHLMV